MYFVEHLRMAASLVNGNKEKQNNNRDEIPFLLNDTSTLRNITFLFSEYSSTFNVSASFRHL